MLVVSMAKTSSEIRSQVYPDRSKQKRVVVLPDTSAALLTFGGTTLGVGVLKRAIRTLSTLPVTLLVATGPNITIDSLDETVEEIAHRCRRRSGGVSWRTHDDNGSSFVWNPRTFDPPER